MQIERKNELVLHLKDEDIDRLREIVDYWQGDNPAPFFDDDYDPNMEMRHWVHELRESL